MQPSQPTPAIAVRPFCYVVRNAMGYYLAHEQGVNQSWDIDKKNALVMTETRAAVLLAYGVGTHKEAVNVRISGANH
jgi:hypothetical protein